MSRVLVIFNPAAARADPMQVRAIDRVLRGEGWDVEVAGTSKPGDAKTIAQQGIDDGVDVIAVYGGDGTTMQAVEAIVGTDTPLGLIPGGTGNLLAGNMRLPRDPVEAARVISSGTLRRIDLGRMERPEGARYFAVACGAGLDAEVMAGTSGKAKRMWGMAAYVVRIAHALRNLQGDRYRVTVDGEVTEMEALTVLVANCGEIVPPFLRLRHGITFDDGLLDVVLLHADGVLQGVRVVGRLLAGLTEGTDLIRFARGRHVTVESDPIRPVELDGEPGGQTPFTVRVVPGAVSILVPHYGGEDRRGRVAEAIG